MKKSIFSVLLYLLSIQIYSQVFNKIYPSVRPELYTVDGIVFTIPLPNREAYFITLSTPLVGPYYKFLIATKIDQNGNALWHKYISDSLGYIFPRHYQFLPNNKIMLAGFKYPPERDTARYWYAIFDTELNMLEEHTYQGTFNKADISHFIISSRGDYVFCAVDNMLNDRGNGATDKIKAVAFSTDSTGQMKWYHEIWDSLQPKDSYDFDKILEDSDGNFYAFGSFLPYGQFPNFKGMVVKISASGELLWKKIYPITGYGLGFYHALILPEDRFLITGSSLDPVNYFNEKAESYIYSIIIDTSGIIQSSHFKNKSFRNSLGNCVLKPDNTLLCGGNYRFIKNQYTDGWVFGMTMEADILWERVLDQVDFRSEQFINVTAAPDGGLYLGGYSWVEGMNQSRNWLVKTDSLGCDDITCLDTDTKDLFQNNLITEIFPNPATDQFILNLYDYIPQRMEVQLINTQGTILRRERIYQGSNVLDIKDLPAGVYSLLIYERGSLLKAEKLLVMGE